MARSTLYEQAGTADPGTQFWAWFKSRLHFGVAGVDARRAKPPDPRLPRWGLAGCRQLDPSHPAALCGSTSDSS